MGLVAPSAIYKNMKKLMSKFKLKRKNLSQNMKVKGKKLMKNKLKTQIRH